MRPCHARRAARLLATTHKPSNPHFPHPSLAPTHPPAQVMYDVLLFFVDRLFVGRAIERFWFLETVARMPYFSYVTCLHLYETLGWWRTAELRKIHFAEVCKCGS
eukprot:251150-Chlamydomonas_euryale.AAC.1